MIGDADWAILSPGLLLGASHHFSVEMVFRSGAIWTRSISKSPLFLSLPAKFEVQLVTQDTVGPVMGFLCDVWKSRFGSIRERPGTEWVVLPQSCCEPPRTISPPSLPDVGISSASLYNLPLLFLILTSCVTLKIIYFSSPHLKTELRLGVISGHLPQCGLPRTGFAGGWGRWGREHGHKADLGQSGNCFSKVCQFFLKSLAIPCPR